MKPIALILTDTHLDENNIDLVKSIWQQAILKCQELKINKIIFGGDFFTARKAQPLLIDKVGREIINNVRLSGIELTMLHGNHDMVDLESEDSYLDEYEDKCNVIRGCDIQSITSNLMIHFVSYFKEDTIYAKFLNEVATEALKRSDRTHILITHIAVNSVRNNDGSLVENDLSINKFSAFKAVYIGHYHNKSSIEPNIYYIGSAYQANYGEDDQKGFSILMEDGSIEFIQSVFKKFIQVKLDITDHEKIKEAQLKYKNSPDNIRFVLQGEEAELKSVNKEKFAELGIDVTFNKDSAVPMNADDLVQKAGSVSFDRSNIDTAFNLFCETKHIEDNSIGKSYLEKI